MKYNWDEENNQLLDISKNITLELRMTMSVS